jgi:hypothetical protein
MAHQNVRYEGQGPLPWPAGPVVPLTVQHLDALAAYDRRHFPAPRRQFLAAWIAQPRTVALALERDGRLCGYGVRRACRVGHKIAPLSADGPAEARTLLTALRAGLRSDEPVQLDLPMPNTAALDLATAAGMRPVFRAARMNLGPAPGLPLDRICGITSFEPG